MPETYRLPSTAEGRRRLQGKTLPKATPKPGPPLPAEEGDPSPAEILRPGGR